MSDLNPSSVRIFRSCTAGRSSAADELFYRYVDQLSRFARARLAPRLRRRMDPEDIVMSAYRSFFVGAQAGQFSIVSSGDLWALLTTITLRKVYRCAARHSAKMRNASLEKYEDDEFNLAQWIATNDPSPEEAAVMADELQVILSEMTASDRRTLELRLQGELLADIAAETGQSERTVRRALAGIRESLRRKYGVTEHVKPTQQDDVDEIHWAPHKANSAVTSLKATITFDQIVLKRLIGRGGMGKVYEAIWRENQKNVAVKFLHKALQHEPFFVDRFLEEACVVQELTHPGIVRTHGVGRTRGGVYFIVMDSMSGGNLADADLPVSWQDATLWIISVADALSYAHKTGIVHCDLKPANVLINDEGRAVLVDFGLAQRPDPAAGRIGAVAGTAPWMAPEQVDSSFGPTTAQTDVYGLGALLFTLLTGGPPYAGQRTSDVLSRLLSADYPSFPQTIKEIIPPNLERLCLMCLAKVTADRPQSADVVAAELRRIKESDLESL